YRGVDILGITWVSIILAISRVLARYRQRPLQIRHTCVALFEGGKRSGMLPAPETAPAGTKKRAAANRANSSGSTEPGHAAKRSDERGEERRGEERRGEERGEEEMR
ncbi:hypothetical protein ALC57_16056, partial [Trachymyrmex cornetzi]